MELNLNIEGIEKYENLLSVMSDILVDERIDDVVGEEYFYKITDALNLELEEVED